MILIIDADYNDTKKIGNVAGVLIDDFEDSEILGFLTTTVTNFGEYESGSFYKRELIGIETLLNKLNIDESTIGCSIDCIILDGYATFNDNEHKALGEYVFEKFNIPVIGIAKKRNIFCKVENTEVYRGNSKSPLYVTAVHAAQSNAKLCVQRMYGDNRIPYAVKLADSIARKNKIQLY